LKPPLATSRIVSDRTDPSLAVFDPESRALGAWPEIGVDVAISDARNVSENVTPATFVTLMLRLWIPAVVLVPWPESVPPLDGARVIAALSVVNACDGPSKAEVAVRALVSVYAGGGAGVGAVAGVAVGAGVGGGAGLRAGEDPPPPPPQAATIKARLVTSTIRVCIAYSPETEKRLTALHLAAATLRWHVVLCRLPAEWRRAGLVCLIAYLLAGTLMYRGTYSLLEPESIA